MSRRLTSDRFYGGVNNRISNLQAFLAYLWRNSPTTNEAAAWIANEFGGTSDTTRDRYLSFLRGLDLVEQVGSHLHPGVNGTIYLRNPAPRTLFKILNANVAGFSLLLDAFVTHGGLTDEQLRQVLNQGPYGHDMDGVGVAVRHREWLQALGYVSRGKDTDGVHRTYLIGQGYELWNDHEEGFPDQNLELASQVDLPGSLLQQIPTNPVPEDFDIDSTPYRGSEQSSAIETIQNAAQEHQAALRELRDYLDDAGYEVYKTKHSDLIATKNTNEEILLFEVKSITDENVWNQLRKAIGQVLEYEYTDIEQRDFWTGTPKPGILLSRPPSQSVQDYLEHLTSTRGILILWLDNGFNGPSENDFQNYLETTAE